MHKARAEMASLVPHLTGLKNSQHPFQAAEPSCQKWLKASVRLSAAHRSNSYADFLSAEPDELRQKVEGQLQSDDGAS